MDRELCCGRAKSLAVGNIGCLRRQHAVDMFNASSIDGDAIASERLKNWSAINVFGLERATETGNDAAPENKLMLKSNEAHVSALNVEGQRR